MDSLCPPRRLPLAVLLPALAVSGCANVTPDEGGLDMPGPPREDMTLRRDLVPPPPPDLFVPPDLSCPLGTPDHCGDCATVCAPGMDNAGTARSCSGPGPDGKCDFVCKGEYYDINGKEADGCEAADVPVQDTAQNAVALVLPDTVDPNFKSNPLNFLGRVYSDRRGHAEAPLARENGREDWFAIDAVGKGDPNSTMEACLSIVSLPADNRFEVCISDVARTTFDPGSCATAAGMANMSACVKPPAKSDAGNPYYVRVRKTMGTPSINGYALFLKH